MNVIHLLPTLSKPRVLLDGGTLLPFTRRLLCFLALSLDAWQLVKSRSKVITRM